MNLGYKVLVIGGIQYGTALSDVEIVSLDGTSNEGCKSIPDLPSVFHQLTGVALPNGTILVFGNTGTFYTTNAYSYSGGTGWTSYPNVLRHNFTFAYSVYVPYLDAVLVTGAESSKLVYPNNMTVVDGPQLNVSYSHHCVQMVNESFSILVDRYKYLGYNWITEEIIILNTRRQPLGSRSCAKTWKYLYSMGGFGSVNPGTTGSTWDLVDRLNINSEVRIENSKWEAIDPLPERRHLGGGVAFENRPYYLGGYFVQDNAASATRTIFRWDGNQWLSNSSVQLAKPRARFATILVPNSVLNCLDIINCPKLPKIPYGNITLSRDGSNTANITCNKDYSLIGQGSRQCQANGTWSGSQPKCISKISTLHM